MQVFNVQFLTSMGSHASGEERLSIGFATRYQAGEYATALAAHDLATKVVILCVESGADEPDQLYSVSFEEPLCGRCKTLVVHRSEGFDSRHSASQYALELVKHYNAVWVAIEPIEVRNGSVENADADRSERPRVRAKRARKK